VSPYLVTVLIPIYNDWVAAALVLEELDRILTGRGLRVNVLFVDDGSSESPDETLPGFEPQAIDRVQVLRLRRNLGHQRAIAIGLAHIEADMACDGVVVMDGDGEDDPADVPKLIDRLRSNGESTIVFAERTRRVDSLMFRGLYACYRFVHWILTGVKVRVGNFSVIPRAQLRRLVVVSELWSHYAAAVYAAKLPRDMIETARRPRLHGQGKMNVVALIGHGLAAMSVHSETLAVRLLVGSFVGAVLLAVGVGAVAWMSIGGTMSVTPAVGTAAVVLLALLAALVVLAAGLAIRTLQGRAGSAFLPLRDYSFYVDETVTLWHRQTRQRPELVPPA